MSFTGPENQLYNVYVDGAIKAMNTAEKSHVFSGIDAGEHTVKVTAMRGGIESKGITAKVTVEAAPTTTPQPTTTTSQPETTPGELPQPTTPQVTTPGEIVEVTTTD